MHNYVMVNLLVEFLKIDILENCVFPHTITPKEKRIFIDLFFVYIYIYIHTYVQENETKIIENLSARKFSISHSINYTDKKCHILFLLEYFILVGFYDDTTLYSV